MGGLTTASFAKSCNSLLFDFSVPSPNLGICVILPARNEATHIEASLDALRLQRDNKGQELEKGVYEVLLLANNCTDATAEIATLYQRRHPGFPLKIAKIELCANDAHIGKIRRILMDEACQRFDLVKNSSGIIASTDSDTVVDERWIFNIMLEMQNGADAVGGRILAAESMSAFMGYQKENEIYRNLIAQVESIVDPVEHDPWPNHFQYFGANMAVKRSVYQAVGGIPSLKHLEDNALYAALFRHDARIRRSPHVTVTTSNRTEGRVEIGFSEQLRKWSEMFEHSIPQKVQSGEEIVAIFKLRKRLRNCWSDLRMRGVCDETELNAIASGLMLETGSLLFHIKKAQYFGELWLNVDAERLRGEWAQIYPAVVIGSAIQTLERFIQ